MIWRERVLFVGIRWIVWWKIKIVTEFSGIFAFASVRRPGRFIMWTRLKTARVNGLNRQYHARVVSHFPITNYFVNTILEHFDENTTWIEQIVIKTGKFPSKRTRKSEIINGRYVRENVYIWRAIVLRQLNNQINGEYKKRVRKKQMKKYVAKEYYIRFV